MAYPTKIATCCHCGTKAALRLNRTVHALSCGSCGAPLRDLKMLPLPARPQAAAVTHQPKPRQFDKVKPKTKARPEARKTKPKKRSKRKGWLAERLRDVAEDMFEEVWDIFD